MKRYVKTVLTAVLSACLIVSGVACGGNSTENEEKAKYGDREHQLNVTVFNSGYGVQWIKDVAKYYMDNVDENTYVKVVDTVMNGSEISKMQAGLTTSDIYMLDGVVDYTYGTVADLSDLYDSYPIGETQYTIAEKMSGILNLYKRADGKYYSLPWGSRLGFSFMYNATSIDEALGVGTWTLPRTTVEFFELGDRLRENNMFLYTAAYGDQMDYLHWGQQVWLAQAMGKEVYDKYFSGYYKVGDEWEFASDYPYMITQNEDNIKSFYNVLYTLGLPGNYYIHANSNVLDFTEIEMVFAGYGYGRNPAKTAFIFEGPWGENEVRLVCDTIGNEFTDKIGALKMPINSQIIARLPSVNDDATLRAVIDYVDGNAASYPAGVTETDVAAVAEARRMTGQIMTANIYLAETSTQKESAKQFLRFLASDVAQSVSMDALNGISTLPFDYKTDVQGTKPVSDYVRTLRELSDGAIYIRTNTGDYEFARVTEFTPYTNTYTILNGIAAMGNAAEVTTPQEYYNSLLKKYADNWSSMISTYNNYKSR